MKFFSSNCDQCSINGEVGSESVRNIKGINAMSELWIHNIVGFNFSISSFYLLVFSYLILTDTSNGLGADVNPESPIVEGLGCPTGIENSNSLISAVKNRKRICLASDSPGQILLPKKLI